LATAIKKNKYNKEVVLFFQDEARYGRLSHPRSCWAPLPERPMVNLAIIREFRYIYAAASPNTGLLHYLFFEQMNTDNMSYYLERLSRKLLKKFIILVFDGASSHTSKKLYIPDNIATIQLPPYSPELNPTEQIWRVLKNRYMVNKYFDTLDLAIKTAEEGMKALASDKRAIIRLTNWHWIRKALKIED
jgi:transposase